ncbi:MAG: DUF4129 domain-containing protein [Gammaproteobacteria bacterium]|nr:DUF4129 domain-containing protein [Gammaproteobacteria bacterium]
MDLYKLQFKANLRSGWQAIDLGFLMAQSWWRPLFMLSAIPSLLVFIPLLLVFWEQPFWAAFVAWWLKPFWERLPLFYASRRVFDEQVSELEILALIKSQYRKDLLPWLLWRRLSFNRAFDAPVTVLEELKGKSRSQRLNVLHGKHTDISLANQLVSFIFEIIVASGLFGILLFFIPDSFDIEAFDSFGNITLVGQWFYTLSIFIAMLLVLPFYSMAGFALYLNRRIELEAWDIEITFRNLSQRKSQPNTNLIASILIALLAVIGGGMPSSSNAAITHDNESAKQLIEDIKKSPDYGQEKVVEKWRFKNWAEQNQGKIPEWFIDFIEWFELNGDGSDIDGLLTTTAFWLKALLVGLFICLLLYLFYRLRGPLGRLAANRRTEVAPDVMFGLDVRPESLPQDVPMQVMSLWQEEQFREALGLLYRAALSRLIEQHALAFKSSHTEAECVALVQARGMESLSNYFTKLTQVWRRLAYGHQLPELIDLQKLCEDWSREMAYGSD